MHRILFLSLILPLAACTADGKPMEAKDFFKSLETTNEAATRDALASSAKAAETKGDFKQAAELYQQASDKQPTNRDLKLALADSLRRSGDADRAIIAYDAVLAQDMSNVPAKEGKALALMAKGDFDAPAILFDQVMQTEPTRWKTLNGLGILFATRGLHSEAAQYFQEAFKFSPTNPAIMNNLALSQAMDRNYDMAMQNLIQASTLVAVGSPERKRVDMNLALVYAVAGKVEEARTITANYFSGPSLDNAVGVYSHLATDNRLANTYLNMALTESKSFYEKAMNSQMANNNVASTTDTAGSANTASVAPPVAIVEAPANISIISPAAASTKTPEVVNISVPAKPEPVAAQKPKPKPKAKSKVKPHIVAAPKPVEIKPEPKVVAVEKPVEKPLPKIVEAKSDPTKDLSTDDKALTTIVSAGD